MGDEEALNKIRWFLMNKGWWERARKLNIKSVGYYYGEEAEKKAKEDENDLIGFILSKDYMVHPNVIKMVRNRDAEGIRMALNHIHYGSLQATRDRQNRTSNSSVEKQDDCHGA